MKPGVLRLCLVCGLAVLICSLAWGFRMEESMMVSTPAQLRPTILLDAGHGGVDGGAIGVDGVLEKDLNLQIALKMRDLLEFSGYSVVMTREEDLSIHSPDAQTIREKKISDLRNRLELLESTPDSVLLSIHQNIFSASTMGAQVFFGPENPQSSDLASILQANFKGMLQPENTRTIKQATSDIYLLYRTTRPAVVVECGFISNGAEAARLSDEDYQARLCFVMLASLAQFFAGS